MMQHFIARPMVNGVTLLGTAPLIDGKQVPALIGDYQTLENFLRYQVRKFGNGHRNWEISIGDTYAPHTVYIAHVTPVSASFQNVPQRMSA